MIHRRMRHHSIVIASQRPLILMHYRNGKEPRLNAEAESSEK